MTASRSDIRAVSHRNPALLPRAAEFLQAFGSSDPPDADGDGAVLSVARQLAGHHLKQWAAEDASRDRDGDDRRLAAAKRAIDAMNAARVGMVEQIDGWAAAHICGPPEAPLHTETLGSVVDRLAVAWVRARRLAEVAQRDAEPAARAHARHALRQLAELGDAYDDLVRDLRTERRRLPHWVALKHYGSTR